MEETTFASPIQPKKSYNMKPFLIIGIVVLVAAIIGGVLFTRQPAKTEEIKETVIEKIEEPTPTEKPKIDKASVTIQVVNGTGTPGQAGIVVTALEEAGFSADNIKTGNAEEYDTLTTTISAKADFEDIVNDIKDVLKPTFDEITVDSTALDEESEFDVVVITGGELFETPTLSPSENPTPSPETSPTVTPSPTLTPAPTT